MELHPMFKVVIGVLGIGVITVAIWLGRNNGDLPVQEDSTGGGAPQNEPPDATEDKSPLPISPTGPYPKVVVAEMTYSFPTMTIGSDGKHLFTVQNKGKAPLLLRKLDTTCECTISNVDDGEIPPGGEAHVELKWKARAVNPDFRETATISTNDPELQLLELVIEGSIEAAIEVKPNDDWTVNRMIVDEPITVSGYVISKVHDSFDLVSPIQSSSKALTAEATPLTPEECRNFAIKCGYKIEATLQPEMPIGLFREHLTIHTDLPDVTPVDIYISGSRTGPISILATGKTRWRSRAMIVDLGTFDASVGTKATLLMFVGGLDETEFKFLSVEKNPETIRVALERDPNFQSQTRQKFFLTFEVPPGNPAQTRGIDRPARIIIKTNHPGADELKFRIQFISR
jgi:hypothetical protein